MTASSKDDIYRDVAKQIERGTFHDVRLREPPVQTRGSRSGYLNAPYGEPLKPLYTEKLPTSPHFPSLAEATQRRRDFWMKIVARGGIAMMVAGPVIAIWKGTGTLPAGAFVAGLITFIAVCFINGNRKRS